MKKKPAHPEGTCFVLPLRDGDYARGVVARTNGKGAMFGYFFGPRLKSPALAVVDHTLHPKNAVLVGKFGDLGLLEEKWQAIGKITPWSRTDWPMPPLCRIDKMAGAAFISHYDEDTFRCVKEVRVKLDEIKPDSFPQDGLLGYVAAEIVVTKALANEGKQNGNK